MQKLALGLVAVAGLATVATARPASNLSLQFSTDDSSWSDDITVAPGSSVFVRVVMSIPDQYFGISGARYNITSAVGAGWDSDGNDTVDLTPGKGSTSDGRMSGFDFGGQTQQVYETGTVNALRIDAKGDNNDTPNAGISTSQNTPGALGTNFNTNKVAAVFKFKVILAGSGNRTIDLAIAQAQITSFKAYETGSSTSGLQIDGATGDTGRITVAVPAPGALALMGLGGLAATRRRR